MTDYNCDLCGSPHSQPILAAQPYIGKHQPPHVCQGCGFVYVRKRRGSAEIAHDWDKIWGAGYSSSWPMVRARLYYVTEWFDQEFGWDGKSVLDIGAGEGDFAKMLVERNAIVTGIEPYKANAPKIAAAGAKAFTGTIRDYTNIINHKYDVVTINWTLENCGDCIDMLRLARKCAKRNGHVLVATGSRILVPFKKPLENYFASHAQDLHSFRFSRNTLAKAFEKSGLYPVKENRWIDGDWLVMVAQEITDKPLAIEDDDPAEVMKFFERWQREWP